MMIMASDFSLFVICAAFGQLCLAQVVPYQEKYFNQVVDHFSFYTKQYGQETFAQRYLILDKWWDKGNGPIFFYTGNEGDITGFWDNSGFVFESAPKFKALVVFAEHPFKAVLNRQLSGQQRSRKSEQLKVKRQKLDSH